MNRKKGIILLLITSVLWSFAGICIKSMSWNSFAITGIRGLIASFVMLLVIKKPRPPRRLYQVLAVLSYVGLVCTMVLATKLTTAANAILLQYTSPLYSAILGYFILHERITRRDMISVVIMFAGLVVFFYDGISSGHLLGDFIALIAGVCYGTMNVFMRADENASPAQNVFWGNLIAFFVMIPFCGQLEWTNINIVLILFLGIIQLGIAYILYSIAIPHVGALDATVTTVLEPILSPVWVMLIGKEGISIATVAGGLIVLFAVVMRSLPEQKTIKK